MPSHPPPSTFPSAPALQLPEVTLLAVTDVAIAATARALAWSQREIAFGDAFFLSSQPPPAGTAATWRKIDPIRSRDSYSRFMLHSLADHFATSHVLCVQWDGYVLDPAGWDATFLNYDYIGAPWPHFDDGMAVGNGGFSLRSRRLVEACTTLPIPDVAEDVAICRVHRQQLEAEFGLRFAPVEVARRFAFERAAPTGREFGFHGGFNMVDLVPTGDRAELFAGLEPGLMNRREHRDVLRAALRRGDLRLARIIWKRLRHLDARRK